MQYKHVLLLHALPFESGKARGAAAAALTAALADI